MTKPLTLPALTASLLLAASATVAQGVPFERVDTDTDGVLDRPEVIAAFGQADQWMLKVDQNADGLISKDEVLANMGGANVQNEVAQTALSEGGGQAVAALARGDDGVGGVSELVRRDDGQGSTAAQAKEEGQSRATAGRAMGEQARQGGQAQAD